MTSSDSNSPVTTMWLFRHPEPAEAAQGRCYGSLDFKLSARGIIQAKAAAQALAHEPLAAIYSSPKLRCRLAGEILAQGRACRVEVVDALRELDFGELEGRTYEEIATLYPNIYREWMARPANVRFPGGESWPEMRVRVLNAVEKIRSDHIGQSVIVVTHGGVIRIALAEALQMGPGDAFRLSLHYGGFSLIRYAGETPIVEVMNAPAPWPAVIGGGCTS